MPGGSTDHIVIYEGPVKFDFMYLKESDFTPNPKWVGCAVLEDASGRVGAAVARSEGLAAPQPTTEELLGLNQKFWTWCWYVFGKIVRGELWEALDGLHSIRSLALVPLLDWAAERPHEGYRRLEHKTDPEAASRLMATAAAVQAPGPVRGTASRDGTVSQPTSGGFRPLRADLRSDAGGDARKRDEPALGCARSAVEKPIEGCGR